MEAPQSELKYTLSDLFNKLPEDERQNAREVLRIACGVSRPTIPQWELVRQCDTREIPHSKLLILADFFQVPVSALLKKQPAKKDFAEIRRVVLQGA